MSGIYLHLLINIFIYFILISFKTLLLLSMMAYTCNPSTWETEAKGVPWIWGQPHVLQGEAWAR